MQDDGKGWPDLFLAHPDLGVLVIECKSRRGRLTVVQSDWLDALTAAGVPAVVARPADYDETIATLTSGIGGEASQARGVKEQPRPEPLGTGRRV